MLSHPLGQDKPGQHLPIRTNAVHVGFDQVTVPCRMQVEPFRVSKGDVRAPKIFGESHVERLVAVRDEVNQELNGLS